MRIISGEKKGRRIPLPVKLEARPTTDFAKEAIFNIISNNFDFEGLKVLDLFAGTGFISYEFASRGAKTVISVDSSNESYRYIRENVKLLNFEMQMNVICSDAFKFLNNCRTKFDIIFADPPYTMEGIEKLPDIIFKNDLLEEGGWLIIEHSKNINLTGHENFIEKRKYGNVNFSILSK